MKGGLRLSDYLERHRAAKGAALLYALSLDERRFKSGIWPGVLASLAAWVGLSMLFSLYVERAARYSLIYGSIGTIIVLLLWLYLSATTLIMGAEFNSVVLETRKTRNGGSA